MNCPLCGNEMTKHYMTLNEGNVKGYTEAFSCPSTSCACVVELKVTDNPTIHDILNGRDM